MSTLAVFLDFSRVQSFQKPMWSFFFFFTFRRLRYIMIAATTISNPRIYPSSPIQSFILSDFHFLFSSTCRYQKLNVFRSEDDFLSGKSCKGSCDLEGATVVEGKRDAKSEECRFNVNVAQPTSKVFEFIAASVEEQQRWVVKIRAVTSVKLPLKARPSLKLQSRAQSTKSKSHAEPLNPPPPTGVYGSRSNRATSKSSSSSSISPSRRQATAVAPQFATKSAVRDAPSSVRRSTTSQRHTSRGAASAAVGAAAVGAARGGASDEKPWLLEGVSRVEAEAVLSSTTAFLVRKSGKTKGAYALSLHWNGDVRHHLLSLSKDPNHFFCINNHVTACTTLAGMIDFLRKPHGPPINWKTPLPRLHITVSGSKFVTSGRCDSSDASPAAGYGSAHPARSAGSESIATTTAHSNASKAATEVAVSLGSYEPPDGSSGKLALKHGDRMTVHLKDPGGWWFVVKGDMEGKNSDAASLSQHCWNRFCVRLPGRLP